MAEKEVSKLDKGTQLVQVAVFGIIAVLFAVAPRHLAGVFMIGALGGLFSLERVYHDKERTWLSKGVFFAEWVSCWLLSFGFKFELFDLTVGGLSLVILANLAELLHERRKERVISLVAWLLLLGFMLVQVVLKHI